MPVLEEKIFRPGKGKFKIILPKEIEGEIDFNGKVKEAFSEKNIVAETATILLQKNVSTIEVEIELFNKKFVVNLAALWHINGGISDKIREL